MVSCYRPSSGMRCDTRLLSSFITGALTATTVTIFLLRVVPWTYVVLPCDPTITARPVQLEDYLDRLDQAQNRQLNQEEAVIEQQPVDTRPRLRRQLPGGGLDPVTNSGLHNIFKNLDYSEKNIMASKQNNIVSKEKDYDMGIRTKSKRKSQAKYDSTRDEKAKVGGFGMTSKLYEDIKLKKMETTKN